MKPVEWTPGTGTGPILVKAHNIGGFVLLSVFGKKESHCQIGSSFTKSGPDPVKWVHSTF